MILPNDPYDRYDPYGEYRPVPARHALTALSADGTRLHVEEYGPADGPAVVLAHGWACSTRFWAPVVRRLAADFRVVAYDQRGHGRSAAPASPAGHGTPALADDLQAVLEAVLPDGERAVLVGHSMGGMTVMAGGGRPAVRARTAAIVLVSTGSGRLLERAEVLPPWFGRLRRPLHRYLLVSRLPLGPVTPLSRAAFSSALLGTDPTREAAAFSARTVQACRARQRAAWGRVLAVLDLDAEVAGLTAPTAVLAGTADKLVPPVHSRELAAALPHCTDLVELPGLGHMLPIEDPVAVVDAIRQVAAEHLPAALPPAAGESA